jgi:hypothetical protein
MITKQRTLLIYNVINAADDLTEANHILEIKMLRCKYNGVMSVYQYYSVRVHFISYRHTKKVKCVLI